MQLESTADRTEGQHHWPPNVSGRWAVPRREPTQIEEAVQCRAVRTADDERCGRQRG